MLRKMILAVAIAFTAVAMFAGTTDAQPIAARALISNVAFGGEVRVQVHMTFFVPGPVDDSEASLKAQEEARRKLYESAARECGVLRAAIASQCRIESINLNLSRYVNGQQGEGFNASGNFNFRVVLK
jgi:hypothetical protein